MPTSPITLIVHPTNRGELSDAFAQAARRVLEAAPLSSELRLVSPYLGHPVLKSLAAERPFRLITDLHACFEASADEALARFLGANLSSVRHRERIHAKLLLSEGAALFGSANLTKSGLGDRDELGCLVEEPALVEQLARWFEELWAMEKPIEREVLDAVVKRGGEVGRARASMSPLEPRLSSTPRGRRSLGWLVMADPIASDSTNAAAVLVMNPDDAVAIEHTADEEVERAELVAQVAKLATSREQAEQVLALMARALEVAGLGVDDPRLHLNFGKTPIHVTIGKRYVIWWWRRRRLELGLILDAEAAASSIAGAKTIWFDDPRTPGLYVPTDQLGAIPPAVLESWERAIRIEVDRRARDGGFLTSNHREKKRRPYLYRVLMDTALRRDIVERAFPSTGCWWFGINNGPGGHVQLEAMQGFLGGQELQFTWTIGHSKPKRLYAGMKPGDRVLVWMGHGRSPGWGLLGTAALSEVRGDAVVLTNARAFKSPLTPYPQKQPQETAEVRFLRDTFGEDFTPLGDVMRAVFGTKPTPPVTVAAVRASAFDAVVKASG